MVLSKPLSDSSSSELQLVSGRFGLGGRGKTMVAAPELQGVKIKIAGGE